jgi:hypothetical protein
MNVLFMEIFTNRQDLTRQVSLSHSQNDMSLRGEVSRTKANSTLLKSSRIHNSHMQV